MTGQRRLRGTLDRWVSEGLIEPAQREAILRSCRDAVPGRWALAYGVIGGVLCVAGVSLLIASNWGTIPDLAKLGGLLGLLVASTVVAVEARARGWSRTWQEPAFLGSAVFPLLGLALVSQIFHLDGPASALAGWWWLAICPLPIFSQSLLAWLVWIVAGYWWIGARLGEGADVDLWNGCAVFAVAGAALGFGSQLWRRARHLGESGEFLGVLTVAASVYVWGFDSTGWLALWGALFVGALCWIGFSLSSGRIHQLNLSFLVVGLVILSTFLRLAGSMADTGTLFVSGGLALLAVAWGLRRLHRHLVHRRP